MHCTERRKGERYGREKTINTKKVESGGKSIACDPSCFARWCR